MTYPSLYRFHDTIAISPPMVGEKRGSTFYLSPEVAKSVGEWLIRAVDDIYSTKFVNSTLPEFGISDEGLQS